MKYNLETIIGHMLKTTAYIHFLKPGLMTSVQDQGRFGYADFGVPYAGAMDQLSYNQANMLLNNQEDAAVLEMAVLGPMMIFELPTRIVFSGAEADIFVNDQLQPIGKLIQIKADDQVKIGRFRKGQWLYMGIEGGIQSPEFLDSKSWYHGISEFSRVQKDSSICYLSEEHFSRSHYSHPKLSADWYQKEVIPAYKGPDWELLTIELQEKLTQQKFSISNISNRMGIHLTELLTNKLPSILTAPVYPGTVQLTPSGKLIVLMRDAQVTGGYPRILQLTDHSINVIAQKKFGENLIFSIIENDKII
ncbi:biotin-dependent carboxylase uncharacterized domain-containing protein [Belliella buryatensis]|uniref:Biotin-dependent carboxylase uncharacterized domain-containing protein n=1 Tax=Belliella buryatensis TaxID=1500549 RepID=A0A239EQM5_9BACT|nr:biotin-dependent carboxyltransferase family protein [Belliella buryatensis]SNS46947.1 biotin-dependent carboxylase uncharacterized domain-containing protein [Belliella buryatensis]